MPARKRSVRARESVEEILDRLIHRLDDLETLTRANRRSLDLQFRRMADMQVEIDRLGPRAPGRRAARLAAPSLWAPISIGG